MVALLWCSQSKAAFCLQLAYEGLMFYTLPPSPLPWLQFMENWCYDRQVSPPQLQHVESMQAAWLHAAVCIAAWETAGTTGLQNLLGTLLAPARPL
jgi:hypothetical protein